MTQMTRSAAGRRGRRAAAPPPRKMAELTRLDYARSVTSGMGGTIAMTGGPELDVEIPGPRRVRVAMRTSYARELLGRLRGARKPRRGECVQILVDCPVEITVDAATLESMIEGLEGEVEDPSTRQKATLRP